ncbi:MAG: hypothetical protein K6G92_01735 [Bacteroidaceae bacterium]|nr:hypothetical protein [Bacteroidaceae bacterium]
MKRIKRNIKTATNLDAIKAMRRGNREAEQELLGPGFHAHNWIQKSKKTYTRKMKHKIFFALWMVLTFGAHAQGFLSVQTVGVLPTNTAEENSRNLQAAIDKMSALGGVLYVEPAEGGYPMQGGIVLKRNVTLLGAHGPTGRGTALPDRSGPTGSLFVITDRQQPFLTVESATQVRGIQFYYPEQAWQDPNGIIAYPTTIRMAPGQYVQGVTLSCLTFYGEYMAMDFRAQAPNICEQILFEHCYGYPLSGQFIAIDRCYDVPRILHCHINPANMREFGRSFKREVIDSVVRQKTYSYWIDHTDNAQLMDLFTFGVYGGIYLGSETYGQMTNFNFDCVGVGIHKLGGQWTNRNWQIAQGSIIANVGERLEDVHPILIEGKGHTSLSNVESFSGGNPALTTLGASWDYITVRGEASVTMTGCRMHGYKADTPIHVSPEAELHTFGCEECPIPPTPPEAKRGKWTTR